MLSEFLSNNVPPARSNHQRRKRQMLSLGLRGAIIAGFFLLAVAAPAQKRDYLTEPEAELIRYHQELDQRIDVFIKAIDRRFAIINGTAPATPKRSDKDEPEWGAVPTGSRSQLLSDISGILDEAITNIDDVGRRDAKNPLISRSLRKLTAAARGYLNQLAALRNSAKDAEEIAAIERAADNANQIIEAGGQLPAAAPEDDKKKKKKP
ncbi:MAG: hypothetical protein AABM67_20375 [Acidobacteriota bacterium]